MKRERRLVWEGLKNVRDLGGIPVVGGTTRFLAAVRSDHPKNLTQAGWTALWNYGVRTIIELGTFGVDEAYQDAKERPESLSPVRLEIEDYTDEEFLSRCVKTGYWETPLYFAETLERWPERHAAVVQAFAKAPQGTVLLHCVRGCDRTGIASLLLLSLAGAKSKEIAADYLITYETLSAKEIESAQSTMNAQNTTFEEAIASALDGFDPVSYLRDAGLSASTIQAAKDRLRGPAE